MTPATALMAVWLTLWGLSDASFTITIVHTNDLHARYEQINKYGSSCRDPAAGCYGGYARLKTEVDKYRQQRPQDTLVLDAGDQFQGTLWFVMYGPNVTSRFVNWIGYDVMTLGNHEFDKGVSGLVPFLQNVTGTMNMVSANIDDSEEPTMAGLFNKSTVRVVAGHRVGIVGYTTVDTPKISFPGKLRFEDVVTSVQQEVERLKSDGVKVIIALGHAGYTVDQQVAKIPGVDVVVGGHTNTFLYTGTPPSNDVPKDVYPKVVKQGDGGVEALVVQCFAWTKYFCVLNVTFNDNGDVVSYSGNPILMDDSVPQDNATLAELKPWKDGLKAMSAEVKGQTLVKLEGNREVCRIRECNLGNLFADSLVDWVLREASRVNWTAVGVIGLVNGGSVRATIDKGDVTMGDIMNVAPFRNQMEAIKIKGRRLREALEYCASKVDPCHSEDLFGGFLQVSGLRVKYDLHQAVGQRVASVQALCNDCEVPKFEPLDDERVYDVLLMNFVANGGDGYDMLSKYTIEKRNFDTLDSTVLSEYITKMSPVHQGLEGRIQYLHGSDHCATSGSVHPHPPPVLLGFLLIITAVVCLF